VEEISDLSATTKTDLLERARQRRRPIREIDTQRAQTLQKVARVAGITVTGRVDEFDSRVKIKQRTGGGWRITIDVDEKPRIEYK
jgi:hypothetical protein